MNKFPNFPSKFSFMVLQKKSKGSDLIQKVADHINLLEKDYFGLTYHDTQGLLNWLNLDKKVGL